MFLNTRHFGVVRIKLCVDKLCIESDEIEFQGVNDHTKYMLALDSQLDYDAQGWGFRADIQLYPHCNQSSRWVDLQDLPGLQRDCSHDSDLQQVPST